MKCNSYSQCFLKRETPEGTQQTTTWLPTEYAEIGKVVKLKDCNGNWTDGWVVKNITPPVSAKIVEANARNYLKQRAASDI